MTANHNTASVASLSAEIDIKLVYLGGSRADTGCAEEIVRLPAGATIADAARQAVALHPRLAPRLASVRWARNFEFAEPHEPLRSGDEVALLPPVCGGAPRARLTREPILAGGLLDEVHTPEVGATALFGGTVRRHSHGREVERIDYEAYEPMATRQLERIALAVAQEHGASDVLIVHRHGTIVVGEVSVAIAAAAVHRDEAFRACRAAIERIKHDVPIWKREVTSDGEHWEGWGGG